MEYGGQDLGSITVTVGDLRAPPSRQQVQSDYQQVIRRVHGVDLAANSRAQART